MLYKGVQLVIYDVTSYTPNEEISATYHHYLLMGLNEETTGGYYSGDFAFFGSFDTKEERIPAQTALTIERLKEKGAIGYPCFLLRKMVMTFNDGTFGWGREGNITLNSYPVLSDASYADTLKNIFWPNHKYSEYFNTYSQIIWFVILFGLLGFCFCKKERKGELSLLNAILLSVLGVILYLMLFEARARYLICFLPMILLVGTVGIARYYSLLETGLKKLISHMKQKQKR